MEKSWFSSSPEGARRWGRGWEFQSVRDVRRGESKDQDCWEARFSGRKRRYKFQNYSVRKQHLGDRAKNTEV